VRYDIVYTKDGPKIEPHFCRQWDEDGGCYGTNPLHGYSKEQADEIVNLYLINKSLDKVRSYT
jgi:hypothetical protein